MTNNLFFKPTPIYKEYMILDLIEKDAHVTQRRLSDAIGSSVSMVNYYLDQYEEQGLIKRKKHSTKNVEYFVSKKGMERKQVLNISYLSASLNIYNSAKENIFLFLKPYVEQGFENIFLYGAGEVCEILLQSIILDNDIQVNVLGIIDDDINKQGHVLLNTKIVSYEEAIKFRHDGIFIASYTHRDSILNKLFKSKYDKSKILQFFD
ncbi:winged helix-turn-helix domain-containing protein [Mycoplasmatota bacterium]|nr:winged helix-turn-helix domain-containing protein [Mycoplasmatota bacterium]